MKKIRITGFSAASNSPYSSVFSWLFVALCTLGIFLIIPIARTIQHLVSAAAGRAAFGYFVIGSVIAGALYLFYSLAFRWKIRSPFRYLSLMVIAGAYLFLTIRLWQGPEEAVHLLEYGLLSFLLFRALRHHIKDRSIYAAVFFAGVIIGFLDEILQWAMPGRYWDLRDVGLNAAACVLFLLALRIGIRPQISSSGISSRSIRIVSSLFAANLIILGLCLSNTPSAVARYTKPFPFLSFLQSQEAMVSPRYTYHDPEIGLFYSRLSPERLECFDREEARESSRILKQWQDRSYPDYLRDHPASVHPFLNEIRVHIFRRDKRLEYSLSSSHIQGRKRNLLIAYKENLILKKYFGQTLARSPYLWPASKEIKILEEIDPGKFYRSPVGAEGIRPPDSILLWGMILSVLALIAVGNVLFARRRR